MNAAEIMRMREEKDFKGLMKLLSDSDLSTRYTAARILGWLEDAQAVDALIKTLSDENIYVRSQAAYSLGQIKDSRAVDALIKAMEDEPDKASDRSQIPKSREARTGFALPDSNILYAAPWALGEIGDKKAVDSLIKLLGDKDWFVRKYAAEALGKIRDERAVDGLLGVIEDEEHEAHGLERFAKNAAAEALGAIGGEKAVEALKKVAGEKEKHNRIAAEILEKRRKGDES